MLVQAIEDGVAVGPINAAEAAEAVPGFLPGTAWKPLVPAFGGRCGGEPESALGSSESSHRHMDGWRLPMQVTDGWRHELTSSCFCRDESEELINPLVVC